MGGRKDDPMQRKAPRTVRTPLRHNHQSLLQLILGLDLKVVPSEMTSLEVRYKDVKDPLPADLLW